MIKNIDLTKIIGTIDNAFIGGDAKWDVFDTIDIRDRVKVENEIWDVVSSRFPNAVEEGNNIIRGFRKIEQE